MRAGQLCSRVVATAVATESVRAAARRMTANRVGTLVVVTSDAVPTPLGVVTDRDIVTRCVAPGLDADEQPVSRIMTSPARTVHEDLPLDEALGQMAGGGTRRVVVVNDARELVGVLSLDDVLDLLVEETGTIGRLLERQRPVITV